MTNQPLSHDYCSRLIIALLLVLKDKRTKVCTPSKRLYNSSLSGGKYAGNMVRLNVSNIYECVEKCCNRVQCDLISWRKNQCYAVSCYSDELCKSSASENDRNILIYINKRQHKRQKHKGILCTISVRCFQKYFSTILLFIIIRYLF